MHKHHIIPKHMGGNNDASNLIELTVEDHAQAHLALYENYGMYQDSIAYRALSGQITSDEARREVSRQRMLSNNPMKNPESVAKSVASRAGYRTSDATKRRLSEALLGKKKSNTENMGKDKAKTYVITDPEGTEFVVTNLKRYCEENGLTEGLMYKVASKNAIPQRKHHRGYKCRKV